MKRAVFILLIAMPVAGCNSEDTADNRVVVAEVGNAVLYSDEIPRIHSGQDDSDSTAMARNYINTWAKRKLLLMKAEENLTTDEKAEVDRDLEETRTNLLIYQYQQKLLIEKMDTVITEQELEQYYALNGSSFTLTSNIVKALFIKLPADAPNTDVVKSLARSNSQEDMQQLEKYCFQFADKFDDFREEWVAMDRLMIELPVTLENQEAFLKNNTFFETSDESYIYLISIRDYRLRASTAPYEYVRNDIRRMIWNSRRIAFLESLENGIYNDALKDNRFKIY
jgi:hypothetical protein